MQTKRTPDISRRRLLRRASAATLGLSAAYLAACGGSDDKTADKPAGSSGPGGISPTPPPGLLARVEDSSARATGGGVYRSFELNDIEGMDPHASGSVQVITVASLPEA